LIKGGSIGDEFVEYINNNWAQSLAITSALFIISVGVSSIVKIAKPQCFKVGTKVLTSNGNKNIEDIKVGDKVWAYNEETKEKELKEVVRLFRNGKLFATEGNQDIGEGVKEWIKVGVSSLKSNDLISCTAGHPFYVLNASLDRLEVCFEGISCNSKVGEGKWISAKDLKTGDKLLLSNGDNAIISSVEVEYYDESQTTYNFEVEDFHTYYVGTEGILVHNTCPETFDVMKFDDEAINIAKQGNPSYGTFKNRLFTEQQRLHGTFEKVVTGKSPFINGQKVILHHPLGRAGANLYNVVGVTQSQHLAIHAIIGYQNANWAGALYNLGSGVF
jgi:hypothetical protein